MTKTIVISIALLLALAFAVGIKLAYFPSVKDEYFVMDQRNLARAPAGLDVVRPTHFSLSIFRKGVIWTGNRASKNGSARVMGRNVPLRNIIAVAWQEDAARIQMPAGAPTNNFDFIVTVSQPRKRLQEALRGEFGYTADKENVETAVLALKVADPSLPGLAVSAADEKENADVKKGTLYITHMPFNELAGGLEQILKTPVVNKTGLTNDYDFSVPLPIMKQLRDEAKARPAVDKLLAGWGLGLEPDTAPVEMLVVKSVH
jgi:uncharacterized protein (TIGR03435 family)